MTGQILRRLSASEAANLTHQPVDDETRRAAAEIVRDVRVGGLDQLLSYAERFDRWTPGTPWLFERPALDEALRTMDDETRALLERLRDRIAAFAMAQRGSLGDLDLPIPGGRAGHRVAPVERAGCYAPAGRFPLPSSLLMEVVTARVAGVREVIVASPAPSLLILATAAIAGADAVLAVGGAQAIAALAHGVGVARCDAVVGPGNRWVAAAKKLVAGDVAIDSIAGPSELVVVADDSANTATVAADLIAQAEHDMDAFPALIATSATVADAVERALAAQLLTLPGQEVARAALGGGICVVVRDLHEAGELCNALAPEHLQLSVRDPAELARQITNSPATFVGEASAQVFGDYGVGGNHVLPTGRGARFASGLSVFTFLRVETWLRLDDPTGYVNEVAALARLEGLEGHARAAECRARTGLRA